MIGHTQEFADAVRGEHNAAFLVEVEREGVIVRTLDVHAGVVDANRAAAHLRRFSASVADPTGELTPVGIRDVLAPFGTVIRMYRGVRHTEITQARQVDDLASEWATGAHVSTTAEEGLAPGSGLYPSTGTYPMSGGDLVLGWVD